MTERLRSQSYAAYADPRRASQSFNQGLSTKKTMLVLVIVVGCFAVLWPKLFYPMLVNNANNQMKPGPVDKTTGCCDVISELDLHTIQIMAELCKTIIDPTGETSPSNKEIVSQCKKAVLQTCGIDISAVLEDRIVSLGHSVKQILEEVRSLNGSLCLKYNFGLSPWRLGVPHRVNINLDPLNSIRQERPTHLKSDMVHPAFKERGRAIPQPDITGIPRRTTPPPKIVEGRPGPIPGMRPAMGGPGHMVPPSKHSNYGFMGVLMPIYTIGFVIFFTYTVMKLVFKKKTEAHVGAPLYPPCDSDERFHKEVFEANKNYFHRPSRDSSKIVVNAVSALLEEVNQELEARKVKTPETVPEQDEIKANGSLPKEDDQGTVTVMAMETTASAESGKKWSRPDSPVLPHPQPIVPKEPSPPPQQIFLEGTLPPQSQILVAESATEAQKDSEDDSSVVLAGKMTLSVISLDSETGTEDSGNSAKRAETSDEDRRTSSSNVSEEFEKINAADLEEQINNIIEEAENIALTDENRYSLNEELDNFTPEIQKAPQINEKENDNDVLEEIKNQLNLEDDLLLALKEQEPEGKVNIPVTDIIKEFLNSEENTLLSQNQDIGFSEFDKEDMEVLERYKRSLGEDGNNQEQEIDENLQEEDNKLLNIAAEGIENVVPAKNEDLESFVKKQDEELINLDFLRDELNKIVIEENLAHEDVTDNVNKVELTEELKEGAVSLDEEESKDCEQEIGSELIEQNLVPDSEPINEQNSGLVQGIIDVEFSVGDQQNLITTSENTQKRLDNEEKLSLIQEVGDSVTAKQNQEESVSDFEKLQENLVTKTDELGASVNQEVNLDSSNNGHQYAVSESEEKNEIVEKTQYREKTPEESKSSNKADLLLQGLIVKDDEKSNDQVDEHKKLQDVLTTKPNKEDISFSTEELEQSTKSKEDTPLHTEEKHLVEDSSSNVDRRIAEDLQERLTEEPKGEETSNEQNIITEALNREEFDSRLLDEDQLIDDADYDEDSEELIDDEVRDINRDVDEDRRESVERRMNGEDVGSSRNGAGNRERVAENEISEDEDLDSEDDEDEEIEEIIEYVDNTDEEGEEVIEINGNEERVHENGAN